MDNIQKKTFSFTDAVFAVITYLLGFELFNLLLYGKGIALTVFYLLFSVYTVSYARYKKGNVTAAITGGAVLTFFSLWYVFISNDYLACWSVLFTVLFVPYWYFLIFNVRGDGSFLDGNAPFDTVKSLIVIPFNNFGNVFSSLSGFRKSGKERTRLSEALLGIILALIPTGIICALLLNAGDGFKAVVGEFFEDIMDSIGNYILPLIFGIPISMYLYGVLYGCSENSFPEMLSSANCEKFRTGSKKLKGITVAFATLPLMLIYAIYIITEGGAMLRGFLGGKSLSAAAVKGFFELCTTSGIAVAFIAIIYFFSKRRADGKANTSMRICAVLISVLNLCVVAIAVWKLYLYIDRYGLTLKRVYAAFVILLISLIFIMLTVKQFIPRFCLIRTACLTAAVLFAALCFCNVNRQIARYNINRTVSSGFTKELDVKSIVNDLTSGGIIELDNAYDKLDKPTQKRVKAALKRQANIIYADEDYDTTFRSFNTEASKAQKILGEYKK